MSIKRALWAVQLMCASAPVKTVSELAACKLLVACFQTTSFPSSWLKLSATLGRSGVYWPCLITIHQTVTKVPDSISDRFTILRLSFSSIRDFSTGESYWGFKMYSVYNWRRKIIWIEYFNFSIIYTFWVKKICKWENFFPFVYLFRLFIYFKSCVNS